MIDWFIILTPFILFPIVLLFVFVGCVLPQDGQAERGANAKFEYPGGLQDLVMSIVVKISWGVAIDGKSSINGENEEKLESFDQSDKILPMGYIHRFEADWVMCHCTVEKKPGGAELLNKSLTVNGRGSYGSYVFYLKHFGGEDLDLRYRYDEWM